MDPRTSIACLLLAACSATPPATYQVTVRVESDPGVALSGAELSSAGQALGSSDLEGLAHLTLRGALGERVPLEVRCPDGFRSPPAAISVVLRVLEPNEPAPEYAVRCPPSVRSLVVAVRAQNAVGVPLRWLGKELARTDDQGAANVILKVAPGEDLTLTLDTSAPEHQALRPKSPTFKLTMPDRDEVTLFDQTFTIERPPVIKRALARPDLPTRF